MSSFGASPKPNETAYPAVEQVILAHSVACKVTLKQSRELLNRPASLEGALARPKHYAIYQDADLIDQAAILLHAIANAHAFIDGNKRAAVGTLYVFLFLNRHLPIVDAIDVAGWALACATGSTPDALARAMRGVIAPIVIV